MVTREQFEKQQKLGRTIFAGVVGLICFVVFFFLAFNLDKYEASARMSESDKAAQEHSFHKNVFRDMLPPDASIRKDVGNDWYIVTIEGREWLVRHNFQDNSVSLSKFWGD